MAPRKILYLTVLIWTAVIFLSFDVRISAGEANYEAGNVAMESLTVRAW